MKFHRAELIDNLELPLGEAIELESLRHVVAPPYLMLMPFIDVPDGIILEEQRSLDEDGIQGCIYHLSSKLPCSGEIIVGFRDIQTGKIIRRKVIQINVR